MGKSVKLLAGFSMRFAAKSSTDSPTTPCTVVQPIVFVLWESDEEGNAIVSVFLYFEYYLLNR